MQPLKIDISMIDSIMNYDIDYEVDETMNFYPLQSQLQRQPQSPSHNICLQFWFDIVACFTHIF